MEQNTEFRVRARASKAKKFRSYQQVVKYHYRIYVLSSVPEHCNNEESYKRKDSKINANVCSKFHNSQSIFSPSIFTAILQSIIIISKLEK